MNNALKFRRDAQKELEKSNKELEKFNKLAVDRELRMVELKKNLSKLKTLSKKMAKKRKK